MHKLELVGQLLVEPKLLASQELLVATRDPDLPLESREFGVMKDKQDVPVGRDIQSQAIVNALRNTVRTQFFAQAKGLESHTVVLDEAETPIQGQYGCEYEKLKKILDAIPEPKTAVVNGGMIFWLNWTGSAMTVPLVDWNQPLIIIKDPKWLTYNYSRLVYDVKEIERGEVLQYHSDLTCRLHPEHVVVIGMERNPSVVASA